MLKAINLLRTVREGRPTLYYADGRRVTQERYDDITRSAARLESMSTTRRGDAWQHRATARTA